jgi:hypothetical protein
MTEAVQPPVEPPAPPPETPLAIPPVPPVEPPKAPVEAEAPKEFIADPKKSDEDNAKALAEWEKANPPVEKSKEPALPDNWREMAAGKDDDLLKLAKRYGSIGGILKALDETKKALRAGKPAAAMPDPKDEKALAEWRKAEGIPDDPTGYKLPESVTKRIVDEDKPILSSFTEFAHKKGARPDVVNIASEWYVEMAEAAQAKQTEADKQALEDAEDALRKDWAHGEYKANMTMAKRWIEGIPGIGADWAEARMPNGKLLGSDPAFITWASDMARQKFGDLAFSTSDGERKHNMRREEIEKIRDTDFERYENEGLDKELRTLIEKDLARGKR